MSNNDPIHVEGAAAVAPQSSSSTSEIWIHFKRQKKNDGNWTATCNNCGIELPGAGGAAEKDTLHLIDHFETCYFQDVGHESSSADETFGFGNSINGAEASRRRNLAAMIICHDYPISIVEHVGFKRLSSALNPLFRMDRQTVRADILKLYYDEKFKMMKLLSKNKSRIAITTDMWSSTDPDKHYMAIKAHFVDESWILQSRLLSFIYMPIPHSEDAFSDVIVQCLMDWNLNQKLSTLTVDNCGTSGDIFECVLNKISPRSLVLGGQLFHMRCCNHILNLMVEDGLSLISDTIEKVRENVDFWTSSKKTEGRFKRACNQLKIPYDKKLVLDCETRWVSTFSMLDSAISYKEVFHRLAKRQRELSLPSEDEWNMAKAICQRLQLFYGVAELFFGPMSPTSNVYFPKMCEVRLALREWLSCTDAVIQRMASSMIAKFDKYWGVINEVMAVGAVLDPRYKMVLLNYFFPRIYGENAPQEIEKVKTVCQDLFMEYKNMSKESETSSSSATAFVTDTSSVRGKEDWRSNFAKYVCENSASMNIKSELDHYLEERPLPINLDEEFDILGWWKIDGFKYPTLQRIARDFLAVPISTVASESTFGTSARLLAPVRRKLRPEIVEALVCAKDWLWTDMQEMNFECYTAQEDTDDEAGSI